MDNKKFAEARKLVNKILKKVNRNDLDWTVQASISSIESRGITYSCQIQSPNSVLQPMTFVKSSWEELKKSLEACAETMDTDDIVLAYHLAEKKRSEDKIKFHEEMIKELEEKKNALASMDIPEDIQKSKQELDKIKNALRTIIDEKKEKSESENRNNRLFLE